MSKLNVGVGEDFPLGDDARQDEREHFCAAARHWRHRGRHRRFGHGPGPAAAIFVLPAAVASVTAAVLYPLATLGVIGGAGLAAAAYGRGRWHHHRDEVMRRWREHQERHEGRGDPHGAQADKPRDEPPAPPKENA